MSILGASALLVGCAPTVKLDTPEPLKVDIAMKVDVYSHSVTTATRKLSEDEAQAIRRRDDRSGEVWTMKNDGAAVEGMQGYLQPRAKAGWDPVYVNRLVSEENADRRLLYAQEAADAKIPLDSIEKEHGLQLRKQIYGRGSKTVKETPVPVTVTPPSPAAAPGR